MSKNIQPETTLDATPVTDVDHAVERTTPSSAGRGADEPPWRGQRILLGDPDESPPGDPHGIVATAAENAMTILGSVIPANGQTETSLRQIDSALTSSELALARARTEEDAHQRDGHRLGRRWQALMIGALTVFGAVTNYLAVLALGLGQIETYLLTAVLTGAELVTVAALANTLKENAK